MEPDTSAAISSMTSKNGLPAGKLLKSRHTYITISRFLNKFPNAPAHDFKPQDKNF